MMQHALSLVRISVIVKRRKFLHMFSVICL